MNYKYIPLTYDGSKGFVVRISLPKLAFVTCMLPFFGFFFCVVWSLIYNFEETTFTHCKVLNYLPSISAAIGNHTVQYIVWCTVITLHTPSRFLFILIYAEFNEKIIKPKHKYLPRIACILNIIENISLLGLTYVASASYYPIHEKCFIAFIATSELYMFITCYMLMYAQNNVPDKRAKFSLQLKTKLLFINATCFTIAGYFFLRHNKYCEPLIYTQFAFFEYIVVISNMAFHLTAAVDFQDQILMIDRRGYEVRWG